MQVKDSASLGKVRRIEDAPGRYIEFCKSTFPNTLDLRGLKIVLDCANGATYHVAPPVFHELGAEIVVIGNRPNGLNINHEVGTTHPQALQQAVVEHKADLGIAFDGDGDRVLMVDSSGQLLEGDQLLYIITAARQQQGTLYGGIVGTLMTNLALEHKFAAMQIPFSRANVGDRYVMEQLNERGWQLGGENSGHILTLDKHSSGDGIVASLQVLEAMVKSKKTLTQLSASLLMYPQVLINIKAHKKINVDKHAEIQAVVLAAESELAGTGRVLLRSSGTEPLIRIMVEGENQTQVENLAQRIADIVEAATLN